MSASALHMPPKSNRHVVTTSVCPFQSSVDTLRTALNRPLRGKESVVELVLACLLARGHLLIEDLPGLGKTTLAKAIANAVGGQFARVQCTPDLLPSDITGFSMFNQRAREFEFVPGPVFADVLLADEINRATPRTQSALFESMAERQATVDRVRRPLPESFFVVATQNPVESHGAYPLPEAQLDRFAMKLRIGYPDRQSELEMLADAVADEQVDSAEPPAALSSVDELRVLQRHVAEVHVCEKLRAYLVDMAEATRARDDLPFGLSPRGLLVWQRLAQAQAHLRGRDFVIPEDILDVARPALSVRLVGDDGDSERIVDEILTSCRVPVLN